MTLVNCTLLVLNPEGKQFFWMDMSPLVLTACPLGVLNLRCDALPSSLQPHLTEIPAIYVSFPGLSGPMGRRKNEKPPPLHTQK